MKCLTKYNLIPIKNIEINDFNGMVYDLTVEDDSSYNVCGIVVHNSACSTRASCGYGVPTFTSIMDCGEFKRDDCYLIADGGINNAGDICKMIAVGSDLVMMGKFFAATSMSPFEKYDKDKNIAVVESEIVYSQYFGMASAKAQEVLYGKEYKSVEGASGLVKYTGKTEDQFNLLLENIRSSVAYYGGCTNWKDFRRKCKMVQITESGRFESGTSTVV